MLYLLVCLFVGTFGLAFVAVAVVHEVTWWRRRKWPCVEGVVVGWKEERDADGDMGYYPEIEFQKPGGTRRFFSTYGSGSAPTVGEAVVVIYDEKGESGEQFSMSNRLIHTVAPLIFGLFWLWLSVAMQPLEPAKQRGGNDAVPGSATPAARCGA